MAEQLRSDHEQEQDFQVQQYSLIMDEYLADYIGASSIGIFGVFGSCEDIFSEQVNSHLPRICPAISI
jgi:hypothetical protein